MSISGRISVDVQFDDTTTSTGLQSLKKIVLDSAMDYTAGKVAIVTGTCGTALVTISVSPTAYKNSACETVSLSEMRRMAFAASPAAYAVHPDGPTLYSENDQVAASMTEPSSASLTVSTTSGTASYTLVVWGDS